MKTLYLVRHAKSSWEGSYLQDYERPLLKEGIERTQKVIAFLQERKIRPEIIASSHAVRALETAKLIADGLEYPHHEILIEAKLYIDKIDSIIDVVYSLPDEKDSAMLVGHNPYITQFANDFLKNKIDYLPTSGVVAVNFKTDKWNQIPSAKKDVNFVIYPKLL